uniref:Protein kinase domain-containing protein n=2 Tax=Caenorhabditis japonica TaxID=281687 RepID=A0A8R1HXS6_CAEJA
MNSLILSKQQKKCHFTVICYDMSQPTLSPSTENLLPIVGLSISGTFSKVPFATTAHSNVFKMQSKLYGRFVAVKIVHRSKIPPNIAEKFLPRELEITMKVRHPHIARCLAITRPIASKIVIISDFYERGTLLDLVLREERIKEHPLAATLFRQIIEAVDYLHKRGIAHRDVKLENIMIDGNGDVKLIDFGFARHIERRERSRSFCGTQPYTSPQISKFRPYEAFSADYYACGVVLYTMVVGKWPKIQTSTELFPEFAPTQACRRLISSLLDEDELNRAGYDECVNSEWMAAQPNWVFANYAYFYEKVPTRTSDQDLANCEMAEC